MIRRREKVSSTDLSHEASSSPCRRISKSINHDEFPQQSKPNYENHRLVEGSSRNHSTKKHRLKTVKKYKISFSYVCTSGENSSEISPKILNLQHLDEVTTTSDHRYVSHKLKPVMTCIVQKLIQEYKRSKESTKFQKYRTKPSTNDTYSLSTSSYENLAKVKMRRALEKGRKEDIITTTNLLKEKHYYHNSDGRSDDNIRTLKSHSTSRLKRALKIKQNSSISSKPFISYNSTPQSVSPGLTRRSISSNRNSNSRNEIIPFFAKDTFLFKRTKTSTYINPDISSLKTQVKILLDSEHNRSCITSVIETHCSLNEEESLNPWNTLSISPIISYCRNIHIPEYSNVGKTSLYTITDTTCNNYICFFGNMECFDSLYQASIHESNYSNEKDGKEKEDKDKESSHIIKEDETKPKDPLKEFDFNKLGSNLTACKLKKIAAKNSKKLDDDDLSSKSSVMTDCEICHGDPVICFEAECRKSLMEQYVDLLEEAQGVTINRKSNNSIDMEHLKKMLYGFMDQNNQYPSENVKSDILSRLSASFTKALIDEKDNLSSVTKKDETFLKEVTTDVPVIFEKIENKGKSLNLKNSSKFDSVKVTKIEGEEENQEKDDKNIKKLSSGKYDLLKADATTTTGIKDESELIKNFPMMPVTKITEENISDVKRINNTVAENVQQQMNDVEIIRNSNADIKENVVNIVETDVLQDKTISISNDKYLPEIIINEKNTINESTLVSDVTDNDVLIETVKTLSNEFNDDIISESKMVSSNQISKRSNSLKVLLPERLISSDKQNLILSEKLEDVLKREGLPEYLEKKMEQNKILFQSVNDEEELTDSKKYLTKPLGRRSTVLRKSVFHIVDNIEIEKANDSIEIDQFSSNDVFVEIIDLLDKIPKSKETDQNRKYSEIKDKRSSIAYESTVTPTTISSTSSMIQISTFSDLPKIKELTTESSYESPDSQDTSEDFKDKYPNETTKFIDISNNISLENEDKVINSLRRSTKKSFSQLIEPFDNVNKYLETQSKLNKKLSPESWKIPKSSTYKDHTSVKLNGTQSFERNFSGKDVATSPMISTEKSTQTNINEPLKRSIIFTEGESQTDKPKSGYLNKSCQTDFGIHKSNGTEMNSELGDNYKNKMNANGKYLDHSITKSNPYESIQRSNPYESIPVKDLEIDNLLNKLRMILSKSEEYLQKLSDMSDKKQNQDSKNISQEIFNLLKNICKKEDSAQLTDEEKYRELNLKLEKLCKSLNSAENKLDDIPLDKVQKNKFDKMTDQLIQNKTKEHNHIEFVDSDTVINESLLDKVVRCVMFKLIENQSEPCLSQRSSPNIRGQAIRSTQQIPQIRKSTGNSSLSRSMENMDFMNKQIPAIRLSNQSDDFEYYDYPEESCVRGSQIRNDYPSQIDSFIGECLPKESTEMINIARSNKEKLDRINIYDEIACRMKDLLKQVKKSQKEVASRNSYHLPNNKCHFSNAGICDGAITQLNSDVKLPRSYSVSDIEASGKSPRRDLTRHTVASIQNISTTLNQAKKIKSGFRNIRKDLKDKASRIMINSKTRQKMLCSSVEEDNCSNSATKSKGLQKNVIRKKIIR